MQTADWIALWSCIVAIVSLIVAIASGYIALRTMRRSDMNASAAMLVTLTVAFRDAWDRVVQSIKVIQNDSGCEDNRYTAFSELLNLFETACAVFNEDSLRGHSKEIMHHYLVNCLKLIVENDYAREQIPKMLNDETTFAHIKMFLKSLHSQQLRFIIPKEWYEL